MRKVTLLHTVKSIYETFPSLIRKALGPDTEIVNIVDEILISNTQKKGCFCEWNMERLLSDMNVASEAGSDLLVVTCSSLTPYVMKLSERIKVPVVTIDRAMCRKAAETGNKILVLATAATTVKPTVERIRGELAELGKDAQIISSLRTDAMDALKNGDVEMHDHILAEEAAMYPDADLIVLAQASMATAETEVAERTHRRVLTSPSSCIEEVKAFYGI
ncbi:MAG: aspartate/glutamate racemase family protein [Bullifex sp.]